VDEKLIPLAHACCETLSRYKELSVSPNHYGWEYSRQR
jgi:hypothetical protein